MKSKIKKLLYNISKNSRISTKSLGKALNTSQQSCSYLLKQFEKKGRFVNYTTIVDPIKLGFMNVLVGLDFFSFDYRRKKEILDELKENKNIVMIEENSQGVDLLVEFCVPNLSAFNKSNMEIVDRHQDDFKLRFILPVIVKHRFERNYFSRNKDMNDIILCGDRDLALVTDSEVKVLYSLIENPDSTFVSISKATGMSIKTISNLKKNLEQKDIIKGYSVTLNHSKLEIMRHHVFLNFSSSGIALMEKFLSYVKENKNIIKFTKLIGEFQVMITIEELKTREVLRDIREIFPIDNYLVLKSDRIHKHRYLP